MQDLAVSLCLALLVCGSNKIYPHVLAARNLTNFYLNYKYVRRKARQGAPTVLFIDEIDSLVSARWELLLFFKKEIYPTNVTVICLETVGVSVNFQLKIEPKTVPLICSETAGVSVNFQLKIEPKTVPLICSETWRVDRCLTRTRSSPHCSQRWTAWGARYRRSSAQVGYLSSWYYSFTKLQDISFRETVHLQDIYSLEIVPLQDIYSRETVHLQNTVFILARLSLYKIFILWTLSLSLDIVPYIYSRARETVLLQDIYSRARETVLLQDIYSRETVPLQGIYSRKTLSLLSYNLFSGQVIVVGATNRPGSLDSALTR